MEPMKPMKPMKPMAPMKPMDPPASDWWPEGLSDPGSSGAQNDLRYAFFPKQRRLAIGLVHGSGEVPDFERAGAKPTRDN